MTYQLETVKVDLGGGLEAVMFKELKRKTSRLVQASTRKFLKMPENGKIKLVETEDGQKTASVVGLVDIDLEKADFSEAVEIMILNQVVSWPFGDVTKEVLDDVPEKYFNRLGEECDKLYGQFPLAQSGVVSLQKASSKP